MTRYSLHDGDIVLHHGDCIQIMQAMPADSVDAVVCDPPYAISFMGREFDTFDSAHAFQAWCQQWATEALRVLRPGGHLLAFGGTRTSHRLASGIEDAGFEIRDSITHLTAGPTLDVGKRTDILSAWIRSSCASSVGVKFVKSPTEAGLNMHSNDSAPEPVLLGTSLKNSPADAIIAELRSNEAHRINEEFWNSARLNADAPIMESNALVSIAESSPANPGAMSTNTSTAPDSAAGWLSESMVGRLKAAEALRIWHGSGPSSRQAATDALCAALTADLLHITCAQSKTFRSYDTISQTVSVSATTATITASTAASLISFTADILARQLQAEGGDATGESFPASLTWLYGSGFP
jgi:hypothetical protein